MSRSSAPKYKKKKRKEIEKKMVTVVVRVAQSKFLENLSHAVHSYNKLSY